MLCVSIITCYCLPTNLPKVEHPHAHNSPFVISLFLLLIFPRFIGKVHKLSVGLSIIVCHSLRTSHFIIWLDLIGHTLT